MMVVFFFFLGSHLTILQLRALNICASMNYQLPNVLFFFSFLGYAEIFLHFTIICCCCQVLYVGVLSLSNPCAVIMFD